MKLKTVHILIYNCRQGGARVMDVFRSYDKAVAVMQALEREENKYPLNEQGMYMIWAKPLQ